MNIKKTLFAAVLALGFMNASAQEQETVEVFNPHWYVQAQVGGQYTTGELGFGDLLSPNAQLGVGYNFNPVVGLRFSINSWQSKAGSTIQNKDYKWSWKYVNPALDVTFDLTNLICGYDYARPYSFGILGGIGANIRFSNDDAVAVNNALNAAYPGVQPNGDQWLRHLWDGTKLALTGRLGVWADYRVSEKVSLGLEGQWNVVTDRYNSKMAPNPDAYWNVLVGVKYNLGATHKSKKVKGCDPVIIEKIVEKPVEKIVEKIIEKPATAAASEVEPLREVIYYQIRISDPNSDEVINKVVNWCQKYPKKGVSVRGYADKGTGNPRVNQNYAKLRADKVAAKLIKRGIDKTRISTSAYGDTVQPFEENDKNRCVIIVGE